MTRETRLLLPVLLGFFVMGFGDIIGTVMNQVTEDCAARAGTIRFWLPIFAYVWFLLISLPTGVLAGRIGRKNTVLVSLAVTLAGLLVPLFASPTRWYLYLVAFALVGIGNTVIQAALPALLAGVTDPGRVTSRLSLGQFVKAICAAATPLVVWAAARLLGDWRLVFPAYAGVTLVAAGCLAAMPYREPPASSASAASFGGTVALLREPLVLTMTVGIFFSVGADVGFAVAIPAYLKDVFRVEKDVAGAGPTVYFVAKTLSAFAGAVLFARVSPARCFPYLMGAGLVGTVALAFAGSPAAFLAVVFVVALLTGNSFGLCMGQAIDRHPEHANGISALMVMAIVGGGAVSALFPPVQRCWGPSGILAVLAACFAYLTAAGWLTDRRTARTAEKGATAQ
ncbi:MAG: MFS transporter [Kiritimatiellia bacterium]